MERTEPLAPSGGAVTTDSSLHQQAVADPATAGGREASATSTTRSARVAQPVAARSGAERVLELARRRGRRGVHSSDFDRRGETADGGPPIRRLAARVDELRKLGHRFETRRRADLTVDYILMLDAAGDELLREAAAALADLEDDVDEPPRLFDPPPAPPLNAALRDWEAA